MTDRRIYLDNAATSFPKPQAVHDAMARYATDLGASPGRGSYRESVQGGQLIAQCRTRLARLFNCPSPDHIVFTLNCSDALNLAIKGIAKSERERKLAAGDTTPIHMITTAMDHNSVLRPLNALAAEPFEPRVEWTCVQADPATGLVDPVDLRAALRANTALVATVHASNVSGTLQPIAGFGEVCRDAGVPLLVDAAQSAGRLPIDVGADGIDLLAAPGHKHLLGPLGTGLLAIRPGLESRLAPLREGGTGTVSELDVHPETMPDRYEPGSHNTIGIVGLSEGVAWIAERGIDALWAHERALVERACDALADTARYPGLTLIGSPTPDHRVGVFSVTHDALPPADLANILESEFGVLTRAGIHCAPRAHANFQTVDTGGATRLSVGPFTSTEDLETALDALAEICAHTATAS
jgi:cysteine desulfurase/selenocysteine lyase